MTGMQLKAAPRHSQTSYNQEAIGPRALKREGFCDSSPFVPDLLQSCDQALGNKLLGTYDRLGLNSARNDMLLEPAHRAEICTHKMQCELKLSG